VTWCGIQEPGRSSAILAVYDLLWHTRSEPHIHIDLVRHTTAGEEVRAFRSLVYTKDDEEQRVLQSLKEAQRRLVKSMKLQVGQASLSSLTVGEVRGRDHERRKGRGWEGS
jgi:hypothetical protein